MSADLPPEAFTKETLQEAFQWLQTQPDLVRNNVHTKERLVALFRRAQRLNDDDHPVSSKKFVTDLKTLANSLDQFSGKPQSFQAPPPPPPQPSVEPPLEPIVEPEPLKTESESAASLTHEETRTETVKKSSVEVTTNTRKTTRQSLSLDSQTAARVAEVQKRFNLSSSDEALRLLVSLGYEKFIEIP